MGLIHELDYNTVVKIAAGEVIERPASVVRELLDNSIDAGAGRISVHISNGGKTYIEVQDNGRGMDKIDLEICTKNHTTSKITSFDDIGRLSTLGFRGEALSSIAEAADLNILSRTGESQSGYSLEVKEGRVLSFKESGMNTGTTVVVKNLFNHIPARLKFLAPDNSEQKFLNREIIKKALAFPEISFEFLIDGKRKYISPDKNSLLERIADFYPDALEYLIPVEGMGAHFSVMGFVTRPAFLRANRMYQNMFVNRRAVEWKNFYFAVNNAYGNLVPKGYFPGVFLYLTVEPEYLDVNVHPMKREVRFREESAISKAVQEAIHRAIMEDTGISEAEEGEVRFTPYEKKISGAISAFMEKKDGFAGDFIRVSPASPITETNHKLPGKELFTAEAQALSACRFVGIIFMTYLLFESDEELIMLDQHAAHERINYEKLKENYDKCLLTPQEFLTPVSIDVPSDIIDGLNENLPLLKSMGFLVEHFGGASFVIRGAPPFIDYQEAGDAVMGFVETLEENSGAKASDFIDRALKQMACKKSVRSRESLSKEEALSLVREWENTPNRFSCPHGRPAAFSISKKDIEKQFKRLGF